MKVVITGGSGYIGRNLVDHLRNLNYSVAIYDKKETQPAEDVQFLNCDFVVHLAAFPGVKNCQDNFERAIIDNVSSAFRMFYIAWLRKVPIIFASSQAAIYPKQSLYGTIKRMIEVEANRYNDQGADIRILRFTNVYGGYDYFEKKSTIIANIVKCIKDNKIFSIFGDGSQKRDFIHVDDICKAITFCMESGPFNDPIDVGTGVETSVKEIVNIFEDKYKKFLFTYNLGSDMIGPMSSIADISRAQEVFNFKYYVKLRDWIDCLEI